MRGAGNPRLPGARRRAFSLLELLAAVMLLTVLMLLAFPAFRGLQRANQRQRAAIEADGLAQAAQAFRRIYGCWPTEGLPLLRALDLGEELVVGRGVGEHVALSNLVAVLVAEDRVRNPRAVVFLELPADARDGDGTAIDPWRQPYVLVLDNGASNFRREGGLVAQITRASDAAAIVLDTPDTAAAFSWGDPAAIGIWDARIVASWRRAP